MLFVIHNLPKNARYSDIKAMLTKRCGLTEFILDNLLPAKNDTMKVTVGIAFDGDAAILKRKIHGFKLDNYQLYVEDKKPNIQPKEQPSRPVESTPRNSLTFNIPAALQPPRNANTNQYMPSAQNLGNFGQSWVQPTVGAQIERQTATNNYQQLIQYPQQKFGQTGNEAWGANQNQGWGSGNQNQGRAQSSHDFGWGNTEQNQSWAANNQSQSWAASNQNQSCGANSQQGWGFNNQSQSQGWEANNQSQGSGSNNQNQGWSPNKANDRSQVWEANSSTNQDSYSGVQTSWNNVGSRRRRSPSPTRPPSPMRPQNPARRSNAQDPWDIRPFDNEPTARSRSPHRNRDYPNRPLRPSRPEPGPNRQQSGPSRQQSGPSRQQSGPSRFNSDGRSRETQSTGRGPQGGRWASQQTDQGNKRRWEDERDPGSGPDPWGYRPEKCPRTLARTPEATAASNPEGPKKAVTYSALKRRRQYYRKRVATRVIDGIFEYLNLNQDDNALKFYFHGPVRSRLDKLYGETVDAQIDEMFEHYMATYKHNEDQKIYKEARLLQTEDKKLDNFLESAGASKPNNAGNQPAPGAFLRPYQHPKLLAIKPVKVEPTFQPTKPKRIRTRKKGQQNTVNSMSKGQPNTVYKYVKPKFEQPRADPPPVFDKIPAYINNSRPQFKAMKQQHLKAMLTLECPKVEPKYMKIINKEMAHFQAMFHKVVEEMDQAKKDYFKICPINAFATDFVKTVKQNVCQRLTNTGIKMIRIYGAPLLPKKPALEAFLKNYGAVSLKKSTRKFLYTAVINNYKNYDLLCNMERVNLNGHSACFKPLHVAPKVPKKFVVANIVNKRTKYIKDQIQKPLVDLLDKNWMEKQAAIEADVKDVKTNILAECAELKAEIENPNSQMENETELFSEDNIKTEPFFENDDQNAVSDINKDHQDIDFSADLDTNEFVSDNQNQSADNNEFANDNQDQSADNNEFANDNQDQSADNNEFVSDNQNKSADNNEFASDNQNQPAGDNELDQDESVSDTSMLKEYSGVSERKIIFDDDDEENGDGNDEKQGDDKTGNEQQVNNTKGKEQQSEDLPSDDVDDDEYDDQNIVADDVDLDDIDDDDLEDY